MKNPKPTWSALYALLPFAFGLLVAVHHWSPDGVWRTLAQAVVTLAVIGAMALWVRANRVALVLHDASGEQAESFRAWVAYQPPAAPRRSIGTAPSDYRARLAA